jgi:hypothetical protein
VFATLAGAILFIWFGSYLWKKGNTKEPFWEALFDVIGQILVWELPIFFHLPYLGCFIWLIGFGVFIIAVTLLLIKLIA